MMRLTVLAALALAGSVRAEELKIVNQWAGQYPTAKLELLPKGQQEAAVGYINDAKTFEAVLKELRPDDKLPEIDFKEHVLLFARNVRFVNSIKITKVELTEGTAKTQSVETRTARPIQDKVFMSVVLVPRKGIKKLDAGGKTIDVVAP